MKTFELSKDLENQKVEITMGELVDLTWGALKRSLPFLPSDLIDDAVVEVAFRIWKNKVSYKKVSATPKKEEKVEKKEPAKPNQVNREKFDKAMDESIDLLLDMMEKILKVERGQ